MQPAEHISQTFCLDRFSEGVTPFTNGKLKLKSALKRTWWIFLVLSGTLNYPVDPEAKTVEPQEGKLISSYSDF
jgi:hypothetical protein